MEESEKDAIRSRVDIVDLIGSYTALKKAGSRYKGLCPFHQEKTPSFTVDPELGRWHCFGACSTGGDIFGFLMKAEGLSFPEATERLAERAGVVLTRRGGGPGDNEAVQRQRDEKERLYAANAAALQFFREQFGRCTLAREYAAQRGLVHETIEGFGVGYAPDDWEQLANYLRKNRIHAEDAVKAGLISPSRRNDGTYTDRFRGRLMFPIVDTQERVVGFGGRLIVESYSDAPKYLNSPETPIFSKSKVLYALNRARKSVQNEERLVVVEGYMDAVACHQAGIEFVVATLGTALTEEHVRLLRRYAARNIILSFDADEAGVRAALRAAELLAASSGGGTSTSDLALRVLSLPRGEDPGSLLLERRDVAGFRRAIDAAEGVPEFHLRSLETKFDLRSEPGKMAFLREAVQIIAAVPSLIEQDVLIRRVAAHHPAFAASGLRAEASLRAEVERFRQGAAGGNAPALDDPFQPTRPQSRGGNAAYRGGNGRGGGGGVPTAYNRGEWRRGNNASTAAPRVVVQDYLPTPRKPYAAEQAERILLRALLDEEWLPVARRLMEEWQRSHPGHLLTFTNPLAGTLVNALWPLLTGGMTPRDAIGQLADDALLTYAEQIVLAEEETETSEITLKSALHQLFLRGLQAKQQEIRSKLAILPEGESVSRNELLRQYSEIARTLKGSSLQGEDNNEGS